MGGFYSNYNDFYGEGFILIIGFWNLSFDFAYGGKPVEAIRNWKFKIC